MKRARLLISWSSGKDSAWMLYRLQADPRWELAGLVTTVNAHRQRVAMHGVRDTLLQRQAHNTGLPVWRVPLPEPCPNATYEQAMAELIARARADGVTHMAFGDLYLEDVRKYRENQLAGTGVEPVFPLWGSDTTALAHEMIEGGLEARLVCLDPARMPPAMAGHAFDQALLAALPPGVDPCGESGEFHTFCHGGPMFRGRLDVRAGTTVRRDGFLFTDLVEAATAA